MSSISFSEFCSLYSVEENWISKGWQKLDVIDGKGIKFWKQLADCLKRDGNGSIVTESGDWFTVAFEVENQELYKIDGGFVSDLKKAITTEDIQRIWSATGNGKDKGADVCEITHQEETFKASSAWNFSVNHFTDFVVPSSLQLSLVAGMFGTSAWFTEGHIETCGDDSVAAILFGQKAFLYANGRAVSRWMRRRLKTCKDFIDVVDAGPPRNWSRNLFFCLPKPTSLLIQPSLSAHSVLTLKGPSFVTGWEAGCEKDLNRLAIVGSQFAPGIGIEEQRIIRTLPAETQRSVMPNVPGDSGDLLRRELESGSIALKSSKMGRKPKRQRNLPTSKAAQERKQQEKRGKLFTEFLLLLFSL